MPAKQATGKRKYILLLAAITVVTAGWTGAWFAGRSVLNGQLEQQFALMSDRGTDIGCGDLTISGFPFRYEVYCTDLRTAGRSGSQSDLAGLNTVALIYNPWHVIAEAKAPAAISLPVNGTTGALTWNSARASAKYSLSALGDVDMVLNRPELDFQNPVVSGRIASDKAEFHMRTAPDETGAVDTFISIDALTTDTMPSLAGPVDARVHIRVLNAEPLLSGKNLRQLLQENGGTVPLLLELAEVVVGKSRFGARGDLKLNTAGTLSGMLTMTLVQPQDVLTSIRPFFPPDSNEFNILQSLLNSLQATATDHRGDPAVEIPVIIDQGLIRIGFVTLGRIPPLFKAGS